MHSAGPPCDDAARADFAEVRPLGRAAYPCTHAHHLYVVRLTLERLDAERKAIMAEGMEAGVALGLHFLAAHELTYYRARFGDLRAARPVASDAAARLFSCRSTRGRATPSRTGWWPD